MIQNPAIQGIAAPEKVYKITDKTGFMLSENYKAGHVVTSREIVESIDPLVIVAANGTEIPYSMNNPNRISLLFVMPAQDVTIYFDDGGITP